MLEQPFCHFDLLLFDSEQLVHILSIPDIVQLGVTRVTDAEFLLAVLAQVASVVGAVLADGVPTRFAEVVSGSDAERRDHREGRLAHVTVVLLRALDCVPVPRLWQAIFLIL